MKKLPIFGLILAGGKSSRLYPFNKILSDLTGSGKSLIQDSFERLGLPRERCYVLTAGDMVGPIRRQLRFSANHIFVDPVRRGTWPAILWAMAHLRKKNPDAVLGIVTGDHVIQGKAAFRQAFKTAIDIATQKPAIVLLGIAPGREATEWRSFGCFRKDATGRVVGFEEKPTLARAQSMIEEGHWEWNSGMFFFRLSTAEAALRQFQPDMYRVYQVICAALAGGQSRQAATLFEDFADKIPHAIEPGRYVDNSIDYAMMTPLIGRGSAELAAYAVSEPRFGWTDLGQWDALRKVVPKDARGNIRIGKVQLAKDVQNSIVVAEKSYSVQGSGLDRIVIAIAQGLALVMTEDKLPFIKEYAQDAQKHPERLVMEHESQRCQTTVKNGRLLVAGATGLDIALQGKRLVVSGKPGFIR